MTTLKTFLVRYARLITVFTHIGIFILSVLSAFLLRFEFVLSANNMDLMRQGILIGVVVKLIVFHTFGLYRGWHRYAGLAEVGWLFGANLVASLVFSGLTYGVVGPSFPRSVYVIDFLLCFLATTVLHFAARLYKEIYLAAARHRQERNILIYGAGSTGLGLLREIRGDPELGYCVVGFLDDAPDKWRSMFFGVPVVGPGREVPQIVDRLQKSKQRIDEIVIAMPSSSGQQMQEVLANCRATGLPCKTIPGIRELLSNQILTSQIRNVSVNDLLGRPPVRIEDTPLRARLSGRTVMVTGAAGSIGAEICRQVSPLAPRRLILFEQAESDLYKLTYELRESHPQLEIVPVVGDIRSRPSLIRVTRDQRVDMIFHAAAYKHVPLMELQPLEAVRNNVMGTLNVILAARDQSVDDVLMISSDKAVHPTSIMGATKRVTELMLSAMPLAPTKFVSVRFGNVLGSNGSVIPLFQSQIAAGGPVTVTHPEMRRYFMTISEAVQLVLFASTLGKGSEIFVLDMGEPVRIVDLARNMIRLAGRVPDQDIEIRYIGSRPGEKLYEELNVGNEDAVPTAHQKIRAFQGPRLKWHEMETWLSELEAFIDRGDELSVVQHLNRIVPEYTPDRRWNLSMAASAGARKSKEQPGYLPAAAGSPITGMA